MCDARTVLALVGITAVAAGCDFAAEGDDPPEPLGQPSISGVVVDFETGEEVAPSGLEVLGVAGTRVSIDGARFAVDGVLPFSVVHLAFAADGHRDTVNAAIEVVDTDVGELTQQIVSLDYASAIASELETGGDTLALIQTVDADGTPRERVTADAFAGVATGVGPLFFDGMLVPQSGRIETTAPAWVAFADVAPGLLQLAGSFGPFLVRAGAAPVRAAAATVITARVTEEALEIPTGVSLKYQVADVFRRRGCTGCHRGGQPGETLGKLKLDKPGELYAELTTELSPSTGAPRIDATDPESSLVLTKPSLEFPSDGHPNSTFSDRFDEDYLLLMGWILDGAPNN